MPARRRPKITFPRDKKLRLRLSAAELADFERAGEAEHEDAPPLTSWARDVLIRHASEVLGNKVLRWRRR